MHLIVGFAAPPPESASTAMQGMSTPQLETLLTRWAEQARSDGDASTLTPPHERSLAAALGLEGDDGCVPWAARQAAADGIAVGTQAWGLLTPAHWRVGSDGVHLVDPDVLALGEAESRTLFDAVRPLFESEGYTLAWGAALRWYAAHESLQGLATASLDRVIGRPIQAWLPRQPEARRLRRLQNEVQMLLHRHPLNVAREVAGALPVNSFWLSGCGAAQTEQPHDVHYDDRLRAAMLQGGAAAWREAWRAIDADAIAALLAAAARSEPARLSLCGERSSATLEPRRRAWWQRVADTLSAPRADRRALLESL
jgi:hypothetical protein